MTYNFDPEKWYENEVRFLKTKVTTGEITQDTFQEAMADLEKKLGAMWERLDGSYRI